MNDRLRIATVLLGHLITGDRGKQLRDRLADVRHCIQLADLLISETETSPPAALNVVAPNTDDPRDPIENAAQARRATPMLAQQLYERRATALRVRPRRPQLRPH